MQLTSYVLGEWVRPAAEINEVRSAVTGDVIAEASNLDLNMKDVLDYAREAGEGLRSLTFHQRADLLKSLTTFLTERKDLLHQLSFSTGATRRDSRVDVDGGIFTLSTYASRAKRELPNKNFILDSGPEALSKSGNFFGQHAFTTMQGVAVHINAYNFPCWGMLEKLAPALLAGVPVVTKPATVTSYVAEALARLIVESGIVPKGAFQFIIGKTGNLFDHLTGQDSVRFTGSLSTSELLRAHPVISLESVRFTSERDSLNAAILGPDAIPGTPEFALFVGEVVREMTSKAGQKCTAIRRALVPNACLEPAIDALRHELSKVVLGDPERDEVTMGPLVSCDQRTAVLADLGKLRQEAEIVSGDLQNFEVNGADRRRAGFMPPVLLLCPKPDAASAVHTKEAFGPVATLMAYDSVDHAVSLAKRGGGSLVMSLYTHDTQTAAEIFLSAAACHGRLAVLDRECANGHTGHGIPLPVLVHGGPGRAGGGEELGGMRAVMQYMQRTALQGGPDMISKITKCWIKSAPQIEKPDHPFRSRFRDLELGQTFHSKERVVTLEDIEHFAHFTGDTFYAHMNEEAVKGHPFFPGRVAHGYLLLSFAAGLFVDPDPGPVLANYGLDSLRFQKPVVPGEAIKVRLTAKQKTPRNKQYGEVVWDVEITTAKGESVATYDLLTMNAV